MSGQLTAVTVCLVAALCTLPKAGGQARGMAHEALMAVVRMGMHLKNLVRYESRAGQETQALVAKAAGKQAKRGVVK